MFSRGNNTVGLDGNAVVDGKHGLVVVGSEDTTAGILEKAWVGRWNGDGARPETRNLP